MYGTQQDLRMVLRQQESLRQDAAAARLAARINKQENRKADARRVFGLRLSHARSQTGGP
jgi:hypothetical protein